MKTVVLVLSITVAMSAMVAGDLGSWDGQATAGADTANTMSVDAISGGSLDSTRTVTEADPFDVDIQIQHGGITELDYSAYEVAICFDSTVLEFVPTDDLDGDTNPESWTYTDFGGLLAHWRLFVESGSCTATLPGTRLLGASSRAGGTTSASGVAAAARFACVAEGTTIVHLVTEEEDVTFAGTLARNGEHLPTALVDATIVCSPPATPTPCPPGVCTPTPMPTHTPTPTPDLSPQPNVMSVDAVSGGSIDINRMLPVGGEFDVDIHIQHGGSASLEYAGYNAPLCFDSTVLGFVPTEDMTGDTVPESWAYTDLGGMFLQAVVMAGPPGYYCTAPADYRVAGGAARTAGTTSASGVAATARFACVAEGATTLHLVTEEEGLTFGATLDSGGHVLPTTLTDATIICLPDIDSDRCGNLDELLRGFDPTDPLDFFSVPVPASGDPEPNGPRSNAVTLEDVLAVLLYVGAYDGDGGSPNPSGVAYDTVKGSCDVEGDTVADKEGLCYDRSPGPGPNPPWEAGAPDGAISMVDVMAVLAQVGLDCTGEP